MNRNNINFNPMVNQFMRNMMMMNGVVGQNQNTNMAMYQNMMGMGMSIYDPKIWSNGGIKNLNDGVNYNCYNNYTKAQNGWKHNEKKFVTDCEF